MGSPNYSDEANTEKPAETIEKKDEDVKAAETLSPEALVEAAKNTTEEINKADEEMNEKLADSDDSTVGAIFDGKT